MNALSFNDAAVITNAEEEKQARTEGRKVMRDQK